MSEWRRDTAVGPHESVTLISIKVKDPGPSRSHITMSGCFGKAEPCVSIHSRIWRRDPVHSDTTREGPRAAVRIPARVSRVGSWTVVWRRMPCGHCTKCRPSWPWRAHDVQQTHNGCRNARHGGRGGRPRGRGRELLRNLVAGRRRMGRVACRAGGRTRHQEDGGRAGAKLQGQMASCHLACGRGQWVWLRRRGGESRVKRGRQWRPEERVGALPSQTTKGGRGWGP